MSPEIAHNITTPEIGPPNGSPYTEPMHPGMEIWGLRSDIGALKHAITLLTGFIHAQNKMLKEANDSRKESNRLNERLSKEVEELRKEMKEFSRKVK